MKRIFFFCFLLAGLSVGAQDAAIDERLNKLNGYVQDLLEDKANQKKQIESLAKEIQGLREQQSQPNSAYATQEDLRKLAEKVQEMEKKREADKELILKEIEKLGKTVGASPSKPPKVTVPETPPGTAPEKGCEYIIQSGDTLSVIAAAYREKNVKVTVDQILKANPGLVPEKLQVGQKIFIPAPKP